MSTRLGQTNAIQIILGQFHLFTRSASTMVADFVDGPSASASASLGDELRQQRQRHHGSSYGMAAAMEWQQHRQQHGSTRRMASNGSGSEVCRCGGTLPARWLCHSTAAQPRRMERLFALMDQRGIWAANSTCARNTKDCRLLNISQFAINCVCITVYVAHESDIIFENIYPLTVICRKEGD